MEYQHPGVLLSYVSCEQEGMLGPLCSLSCECSLWCSLSYGLCSSLCFLSCGLCSPSYVLYSS